MRLRLVGWVFVFWQAVGQAAVLVHQFVEEADDGVCWDRNKHVMGRLDELMHQYRCLTYGLRKRTKPTRRAVAAACWSPHIGLMSCNATHCRSCAHEMLLMTRPSLVRRGKAMHEKIARLAFRQLGLVTRQQLLGLGSGQDSIGYRLETSGQLIAVDPLRLSDRWDAHYVRSATSCTLLAAGPESAASNRAAAVVWKVEDVPDQPS